ncbi:MAG TPA: matrixin family metalloprotease [Candidatus Aquilonibacter sp.]|nr:matrixin family metalloprotease [Candidatus Aquilonibacter sp.]
MKHAHAAAAAWVVLWALSVSPANAYLTDSTVPQSGGCPALDRWNLSAALPLERQWSTSLPGSPQTILTVAAAGSGAQLNEIEQAISDSFGAWSGVTGTTLNAAAYPRAIGPLARVSAADSCTNDNESNIDGLNTICFNQSSMGFTTGVLAFTRVITANAPGVVVGSEAPASFAGQILDSDTLFRNDGQATFATPAALATPQGQGAYDLESLLIHEIGHWLGFDHSAIWRAIMFPYAPPPGTFLGSRPTAQAPDGPLSDDDRAGIRLLYPDPNDAVNVGAILGRVLPANPFALATLASPAPGSFVTGVFGAHVVAVDSDTGAVIAGTLGGWTCDPSSSTLQFDGSFDIERLPVGHTYVIYAEPLVGLALPADFSDALRDLCASSETTVCATPPVDTNFNPRFLPDAP